MNEITNAKNSLINPIEIEKGTSRSANTFDTGNYQPDDVTTTLVEGTSQTFTIYASAVCKLVALYTAEVRRASLQNAPKPLKTLRYVRRLPDSGIRLSVLVECYKQKLAEVLNG